MKSIVEEAVKAAVTEALKAVNNEAARIIAEAVSTAVREALAAVRAELEAQRVMLQRVEDAVRQRKGEGARAVARGEVKITLKPGSLHWQIVQILQGRELTKEEIAKELERRFGRKVSGNSLSGRLSELRGAGIVECVRRGKTWLWRLANDNIPAASAKKWSAAEIPRRETRPAAQQPERQPPAYVAPARASDIPAANIPAASQSGGGLPSFAQGNPWLEILSGRGETSAPSAAARSASSDLPSFVQDNPWLEVLSGRGLGNGEANGASTSSSASSVDNSGLPSFAADNPWLAILSRR
jgi:DNA-binding transcriptional ArsR family regulator